MLHSPFITQLSTTDMAHLENMILTISMSKNSTFFRDVQINHFCIELLALYTERISQEATNYSALVNQIISKMQMANNFKLGLTKILELFPSYSQNYLCRLFKQHTGMTMTDYLNNIRINYAVLLLKTQNLSVQQIAYECGFKNISYFNRVFREYYNMTPTQFKKTRH